MIEVLKQMVEALEWCHGGEPVGTAEAIQAGKQAIKELESQEPVAYIHRNEYNEYRLEPHDNFDIKSIPFNVDVPLFRSSSQRKPLMASEIVLMYDENPRCDADMIEFARAIEAAHGIKGES